MHRRLSLALAASLLAFSAQAHANAKDNGHQPLHVDELSAFFVVDDVDGDGVLEPGDSLRASATGRTLVLTAASLSQEGTLASDLATLHGARVLVTTTSAARFILFEQGDRKAPSGLRGGLVVRYRANRRAAVRPPMDAWDRGEEVMAVTMSVANAQTVALAHLLAGLVASEAALNDLFDLPASASKRAQWLLAQHDARFRRVESELDLTQRG